MSPRTMAAVWIVAVIVTPLGLATANAQPPDLSEPARRTGGLLPEERPRDLRLRVRSLLIGLHPAAGLVDVDCLVDADDKPPALLFNLSKLLRGLGLFDE